MDRPLPIAYFLGKFPQLTQTFVTREVFWIRRHGVEPLVFSFSRPRTLPAQDEVEALLPLTRYCSYLGGDALKALGYFLIRSPIRLAKAVGSVFQNTRGEIPLRLRALWALPRALCFAREIQRRGIGHVHAHFLTLASVEACAVAALLEIDYSITVHAVGLFTRVPRNIRRQMLGAARVITISSFHRKRIFALCPEMPPDRLKIVHCGLETSRFQPTARTPAATPSVPRILAIGRLIEKKGFAYLVDACACLAKGGIPFECHVIGDGPLASQLADQVSRSGIGNRVSFLGAVGQPEVLESFSRSDVFALPCVVGEDGNADGLPVVLVEAMSCGLPVVTTPVAGIVDLVEDGVTGRLVPERDVAALADALRSLLEDPAGRLELGRAGREKVRREFEIAETTRHLADAFREARTPPPFVHRARVE